MNFSSANNTNQSNIFGATQNKPLFGGAMAPQSNPSGSFFGQNTNQQQQQQQNQNPLGMFSNPQQQQQLQQPQQNLGFFGSSTNQQQNQSANLFNKPTGTSVSFTNPQAQGSFFSASAQPAQQTGLFGMGNAVAQQPQNQMAPVQAQQNQNQMQMQMQMMNPLNYKKEQDKKEIIDVVQSYLNCLNIQSPLNSFKYMLYNRVTDDSAHSIGFQQQPKTQDFTEEGEPFLIDQELWHKALRNNPDSRLFYPSLICSPKALDARAKILEILEYQKLDYLINLRQKINNLSVLYDSDIQNINSNIKNKLNLIKHKQMNVIYKLEKLAILTGKAEKNYNLENKLNLKLNEIKHTITNKDSYVGRLKNLSSVTTLMSFDNSTDVEEDPLKDFTKERFEKNIAVLKNMKKIFDGNFSKLRKSVSDLNAIKSDLDNFKKYERINK